MPAVKVIWNYTAGPGLERQFAALAGQGLEITACPEGDDARLFRLLEDAEVLWHCLRPVDERVLQAGPELKLVQKIGVGVNTIDLEVARVRGIAVCNMPGSNSQAVAEQTLGLMLAVLRQLPRFDQDVRAGNGWSWDPPRQDVLGEISGRTVGLAGFGAVPQALAPVLTALGARVLYTARSDKHTALAEYRPLAELLRESDIVSLHMPLTDATERLFNAARFAAMKPGAVFINTARGGLVDETALLEALRSGRLRGAGLDVFASEPPAPDHPLLGRADVVLAPHVAWLTEETLARSLALAVENCRRLATDEPLLHRVA